LPAPKIFRLMLLVILDKQLHVCSENSLSYESPNISNVEEVLSIDGWEARSGFSAGRLSATGDDSELLRRLIVLLELLLCQTELTWSYIKQLSTG